MTVRKTESRIPDGYLATDLGEIGSISELNRLPEHSYLISFLSSPITVESMNTYVVMIRKPDDSTNAPHLDDVSGYEWTVKTVKHDDIEVTHIESFKTKEGIFEFRPLEACHSLIVEVSVLAGLEEESLGILKIEQVVKEKNSAFEDFLSSPPNDDSNERTMRGPYAGNKETTREYFYDLKPYVDDAIQRSTINNPVPAQLLKSIVYLQALSKAKELPTESNSTNSTNQAVDENPSRPRLYQLGSAAKEVNAGWGDPLIGLGICQIAPQIVAMLLAKPGCEWLEDPQTIDEQGRTIVETISRNYRDLSINDKVDIYNLLRFPKTNIRIALDLLNQLKNRDIERTIESQASSPPETCRNGYKDMSTNDFVECETGLKLIAKEFDQGPIFANRPSEPDETDVSDSEFGDKIFNQMYAPYLVYEFDEMLPWEITGIVRDADDSDKLISDARVDLYKTMLEVTYAGIPIYESIDNWEHEEPIETLPQSTDHIAVFEIIREPEGYPDYDFARINFGLLSQGKWIIIRHNNEHYVRLHSVKEEDVTHVRNGTFTLLVSSQQPYKVRVVKEPENDVGYFDGESDWVLPPAEVEIEMKSARHMLKESEIVDQLVHWIGRRYDTPDGRADYPLGYEIISNWYRGAASVPPVIDCNTFVEALVIKAWNDRFRLSWDPAQHHLKLSNFFRVENRVENNVEVNVITGAFFSSVNVFTEQTIWVETNPTTRFRVTLNGTTVTVDHGDTEGDTAKNIVDVLMGDRTINQIVRARYERQRRDQRHVVLVRSSNEQECYYQIRIQNNTGRFRFQNSVVLPAIKVDLSSDDIPPPWSVVQGWSGWTAVPPSWPGHNFFIVDVTTDSKRVLSLDSNVPAANNGPGFRRIGHISNLQTNQGQPNNRITPNHSYSFPDPFSHVIHWSQRQTESWNDLKDNFDACDDRLGIVRLKLYDLKLSKPIL